MSGKGESLEDLVGNFQQQVKNSDWLKENTPEKWISENKELHQQMQDEVKRLEAEREAKKKESS